MIRRSKIITLTSVTVCLLITGCGGTGGTDPATFPTMFFINASADTTALDLLLNETALSTNFAYLDTSPDFEANEFLDDEEGAYDITTQDTGTEEVFDNHNRVFSLETHTVIIALGLQNFGSENVKRLQSVFINIDRTSPNGNKAKLYVVNAFVREAGFSTPQIEFQNPGENPQFQTPGIDFGSSTSFVVDSGTMDWVAKRKDADGSAIYASKTTTLNPGGIYLVLVSGIENDAIPARQPSITFIELPSD